MSVETLDGQQGNYDDIKVTSIRLEWKPNLTLTDNWGWLLGFEARIQGRKFIVADICGQDEHDPPTLLDIEMCVQIARSTFLRKLEELRQNDEKT